jgi:hypothetical protein
LVGADDVDELGAGVAPLPLPFDLSLPFDDVD